MFNSLKGQFQASVAMSTRLFDEGVERQVKFATEMMNIGVESGKQIRSCKSLTEVVAAQKAYLENVQAEVTDLNTGTTAALKELRDSANEAITTAVQAVKATASKKEAASEEVAPAAAADAATKATASKKKAA